ncbi:MAG: LuxR C-terminal-related transcriptional regulator [Marmoricola sp.]
MTHAIDSTMLAGPARQARRDLPHLPDWVVPRHRLADRLDLGASGLLTLVTAPPGWGKTMGVAAWAASAPLAGGLVWLSAAGAPADLGLFWKIAHTALVEAGAPHLPLVPAVGSQDPRRLRGLAQLGTALRHSGPWLLVLDDFPTGQVDDLGRDLEIVMDHAQRALSVMIISHGEPALAVQRHHVAGDLTRVTRQDLALDRHEVAAVLARHDVDARELTARTVERHTGGWPCGVRLVAEALRDATTIEEAMAVADRATVAYLESEVLAKSPARLRELIIRTSMVEEVGPDLARTVLGPHSDVMLVPEAEDNQFIELGSEGSFRCHPLLREAASRQLGREPLAVVGEARRQAAQWHIDHDRSNAGLEVLIAAQDWASVGHALVETYAVPRILVGSIEGVAESALAIGAVRAAEPLLEAALLLSRGGPDAADAVLAVVADRPTGIGETTAGELSAIFVRLAVARARGDVETGLPLATRARELMAHLRIERQRELFTMLEASVGALELCNGDVNRAEVTLRHGAVGAPGENTTSSAPLDCLGQLALLEAYRGNLRQAERLAAALLKSAGPSPWAGVAHAHLATAWVHLERGEQGPARQHLDRADGVGSDAAEPWYSTARLVAEAKLLVMIGQPEAALRLLAPALQATQQPGRRPCWSRDLLVLTMAHALLATGEPAMALDLLSQGTSTPLVETRLLVGKARAELDDIAGARTALASVAPDLSGAPLATQIECWLLEARVAGETERARVLVDRALREAGREMMRRPVAPESSWLLPVVDGDPSLRRSHGGFLAGLRSPTHGLSSRTSGGCQEAPELIETLTGREAEVLGLLADMCSTEEIARELFLSVNTVKTYVRGILR